MLSILKVDCVVQPARKQIEKVGEFEVDGVHTSVCFTSLVFHFDAIDQ